ncbi:hypothetical protein [Alkalihalobacillus sp. AL-G]|uniref:hypothetical protein n=1 Tax=Alkalihalobacillus sp. AL-G TaxID=2926399 RepID=UPI00272D11F0|nr:hypothetical protein [Alkalihalobacillus sp. AL-G]WLD91595.1 hypothetical protein MOJ78_11105 [Alkalihalobacillus sp. AL-G]
MYWIRNLFCFPTVVWIARNQDELKRVLSKLQEVNISVRVETGTNRDIVCSNGRSVYKVKVCAVHYMVAKSLLRRTKSFSH